MARNDDVMVTVSLQIPRSALTIEDAPPDLLSQKNILATCAIPPRRFLEMLRRSPVPVTKLGRLRLVDRIAFTDWVKSTANVPTRREGSARALAAGSKPSCPAGAVESLAWRFGAEVSPELAEAAAQEARELTLGVANLLTELGLELVDQHDPQGELKEAMQAVELAAEKLGDRKAIERFAKEQGQKPCPSCHRWSDEPPCADCRGKAREAARIPCLACGRRIAPCRDGLCRRCRKADRLRNIEAAARNRRDGRQPVPRKAGSQS